MTHADLDVWLREHNFDVDKIKDDDFDKIESYIDELEDETLDEEADNNCREAVCRFGMNKLPRFKSKL